MATSKIKYLNKYFIETSCKNEIVYVEKTIIKSIYKLIMINEIYWLRILEHLNFTPTIISTDNKSYFIMTYMGERIKKETLPKNWKKQIKNILKLLTENSCHHNDIKLTEILIKENKISLIDFQHATKSRKEFIYLKKEGICGCRNNVTDADAFKILLGNLENKGKLK